MKIHRRQAVLGITSALLGPAACTLLPEQSFATATFAHGIASGDPAADSVVLWTRVSGQTNDVAVRWTVATDPGMSRLVASGTTTTSAARDFTVKVLAQGLAQGQTYFYQFDVEGNASPIGRTRTLPTGRVEQLVIAVTSCSNYPFGHFNGYQAIADDPDVDVVVHLGDYLYEYGEDGYGSEDGKRLGRIHEPRHEIVSLNDYRQRHAQYKKDSGSLSMHATHPLIPTWDDHESTNNPWSGGAQNHQPDEGAWPDRRSVSLRAYYEWMPVREPALGEPAESRHAHFRFGDLASLYAVETRHLARAQQIDLRAYRDRLDTADNAARFYDEVVGAKERRMVSVSDEAFLQNGLAESVAEGQPWRILANQTILARVVAPTLNDATFVAATQELSGRSKALLDNLATLGNAAIPANMDAWDGYPAARESLFQAASTAGAKDLLVITGDTHKFWQNRLFNADGRAAGLELGTSGITSPGGFDELGPVGMTRYEELTSEQNDSVEWVEARARGYIKLTLQREQARADFIAISTTETRNFTTNVVRSARIVHRDGTLDYV